MAVHFKFASEKAFDSLPIAGNFISVGKFKEKILEHKKISGKSRIGTELLVLDYYTNEEYRDDKMMLPKYLSVTLRRRPIGTPMPIVVGGPSKDQKRQAEAKSEQIENIGQGFRRQRRVPPQRYVCHRCGIGGHFIQHCPTNGDRSFDIQRSNAITNAPAIAAAAASSFSPAKLLPELHCPICAEVMKDAVFTSKCCFKSFCKKCISQFTLSNSACVCGKASVTADDLLPNITLRDTILRFLKKRTHEGIAESSVKETENKTEVNKSKRRCVGIADCRNRNVAGSREILI